MPKYSKKTQRTVATAMRKYKKRKLKRGKSKKPVTSRKQAIAIGLSEARAKGEEVPKTPRKKRKRKKSTAQRTSSAKKTSHKRKKSNQ